MIAAKSTYTTLSVLSVAAGLTAPAVDGIGVFNHVMLAFGVDLPGPVFLAGLAFAVAGAFMALARQLPQDRADKWWTLAAALAMGTAAAIVQKWAGLTIHVNIGTMPPQVFMFIAGLSSRTLVDWLRVGDPIGALKSILTMAFGLFGGRK